MALVWRLLFFLLPASLLAQSAPANLAFENGTPGEPPPGWIVPQVLRSLGYSAEFRREGCRSASGCAVILAPSAPPPETYGNLTQRFDAAPFRGKTVRLRAFVRVEPAPLAGRALADHTPASRAPANRAPADRTPADHAQLWLRVDLPNQQMGFFDDMGDRPIYSPQWTSYEITGAVAADAESINIGVMSYGKSPVWIDGLSFETVPDEASSSGLIAARAEIQKLYARIDAAYAQKGPRRGCQPCAARRRDPHAGTTNILLTWSAASQIMLEMEKGATYTSRSAITDVRLSAAEGTAETSEAIVSVNNQATRTSSGGTQILISANRDTWVKTGDGWKLKESDLISTRSITPADRFPRGRQARGGRI